MRFHLRPPLLEDRKSGAYRRGISRGSRRSPAEASQLQTLALHCPIADMAGPLFANSGEILPDDEAAQYVGGYLK
jgi:hypothetical protein